MYSILILDDEDLIRLSLVKKVEKAPIDFSRIEQASTAEEALLLVKKNHFDIVISDIRLGKHNGLDFISQAKEISPNTLFIVLSGFREFSYAKKALSLQVFDYLLKPIDTVDFYETLRKCILKIEERTSLSHKITHIEKNSRYQEIRSSFLQGLNEKNFHCEYYLSSHTSESSVIETILFFPDSAKQQKITEQFLFSVISLPWKEDTNCIIFSENMYKKVILFSFPTEEKERYEKFALQAVRIIAEELLLLGFYQFSFGLSDAKKHVYEAHGEAFFALQNRIFLEDNQVILYSQQKNRKTRFNLSASQISYYNSLVDRIDCKLLHKFFQEVLQQLLSFPDIAYSSVQVLYNTLKDRLLFTYPTAFQGISFHPDLFVFDSLTKMIDYLSSAVLTIAETVKAEEESQNWIIIMLTHIKKTIESHFAEKLMLESFAQQHHVSVGFLSTQFSNHFGISYQDYLAKIRIENGKEMLKENKYTINQISELCGFSNQHYFSKVFKNKTGLTPSEYKMQIDIKK